MPTDHKGTPSKDHTGKNPHERIDEAKHKEKRKDKEIDTRPVIRKKEG